MKAGKYTAQGRVGEQALSEVTEEQHLSLKKASALV
jgi:hypothetical protein